MTIRVVIWLVGGVAVLALTYALALAGEPQALWLWRDVLGVVEQGRG